MSRSVQVLVVEDEAMIALDIEAELNERGFEVLGPTGNLSSTLNLLSTQMPSIALLDINLGQNTSFEIAQTLADHGVPFVFLSGDTGKLPKRFADRRVLAKPIDFDELDSVINTEIG